MPKSRLATSSPLKIHLQAPKVPIVALGSPLTCVHLANSLVSSLLRVR